METLTRNPFTDKKVLSLIRDSLDGYKACPLQQQRAINEALHKVASLDPYANPVTKNELRAWLLGNGFEERETGDPIIKSYENKGTQEKLVIVFIDNAYWWGYSETRTEIEIRARKRNIHPFTLYAEIKLKYGTNNK